MPFSSDGEWRPSVGAMVASRVLASSGWLAGLLLTGWTLVGCLKAEPGVDYIGSGLAAATLGVLIVLLVATCRRLDDVPSTLILAGLAALTLSMAVRSISGHDVVFSQEVDPVGPVVGAATSTLALLRRFRASSFRQ